MKTFEYHDRVKTPLGEGSVFFVRMSHPDYSRPEAYSVILDSTGKPTIFPADQVEDVPLIEIKS
jgi:hypothetical protein